MLYNNIGYYAVPKEGLRVLVDLAFELTDGQIKRRDKLSLPDRDFIIKKFQDKRPAGLDIYRFRLDISNEISATELMLAFAGRPDQYAWVITMMLNTRLAQPLVNTDIIERKSLVPTSDELLYHFWSDRVSEYVLPMTVGAQGTYVNISTMLDEMLLPTREIVNLWYNTAREFREARQFVHFSYLQNVVQDEGINDIGYVAPLLPYSSYVAFEVRDRSKASYSIEVLTRGAAAYMKIIASGLYTDSDILGAKYVRAIERTSGTYVVKRILFPNFGAPYVAAVWQLKGAVNILNVNHEVSSALTKLSALLPAVRDRALYNYIKRNDNNEEFLMLQAALWKQAVAGSIWSPNKLQDLYTAYPIPGCPVLLEQGQKITNMDIAIGIGDLYKQPGSVPIGWSGDRFEGMICRFPKEAIKEFPKLNFYEPVVNGYIVAYDVSSYLEVSEMLCNLVVEHLSYISLLEWYEQYVAMFIQRFNYTDYEVLMDLAPSEPARRLAQIMGYRETSTDEALLRILLRAKFSIICFLFDLVHVGLGQTLAARYDVYLEDSYMSGRSVDMIKGR